VSWKPKYYVHPCPWITAPRGRLRPKLPHFLWRWWYSKRIRIVWGKAIDVYEQTEKAFRCVPKVRFTSRRRKGRK
jgi:hypothetical protein